MYTRTSKGEGTQQEPAPPPEHMEKSKLKKRRKYTKY
jgi:hypothetical protein